jgi:hypothetical protein
MTVLRWELTRGDERVYCEIDRDPRTGTFAVVILNDLRRASLETYQALASAFRRHARVVSDLRGSGWKLSAYTQ